MVRMQTLSDLTERALSYIKTIGARGSMPNALIVNGPDADLCRKYAVQLSAAVACQNDNNPCFSCENCRRILGGITPDIIDVFPEDGKQSINVDQARYIRSDAYIAPSEMDFKVYILHSADKMNSAAQNALLKILEEPPVFASFILISANTAAFLPTVRSRCQLVNVEPTEIKQKGKRPKAMLLADETLGALAGNRKSALIDITASTSTDRQEYKAYILALIQAFRDIMACKSGAEKLLFFDDPEKCSFYSSCFSESAVLRAFDVLNEALVENDANIYILLSQTRLTSGLWHSIHP